MASRKRGKPSGASTKAQPQKAAVGAGARAEPAKAARRRAGRNAEADREVAALVARCAADTAFRHALLAALTPRFLEAEAQAEAAASQSDDDGAQGVGNAPGEGKAADDAAGSNNTPNEVRLDVRPRYIGTLNLKVAAINWNRND
jgi:hypothetical protein